MIESLFGKLNHYRPISTHYEKRVYHLKGHAGICGCSAVAALIRQQNLLFLSSPRNLIPSSLHSFLDEDMVVRLLMLA